MKHRRRLHSFLAPILLLAVTAPGARAQKVYWHHFEPGTSSKIMHADLDGSNASDLINIGTEGCGDIAIDQVGGKIYWSEFAGIKRASLDGTDVEVFLVTEQSPGALAIDEVHRWIYWGRDVGWNYGVNRATLDAQIVEDILFLGTDYGIDGIALDSEGDTLYLIVLDGVIYSSRLDGSQRQTLIGNAGTWTFDVAVDPAARKLYWTDVAENTIRRANIDGSAVELLPLAVSRPYKIEIDPCVGFLYWNEVLAPPGNGLGPLKRARIGGQQIKQIVPSAVNYIAVTKLRDQANPAACIPAISPMGMVALAGCLAAAALWVMRRRWDLARNLLQ